MAHLALIEDKYSKSSLDLTCQIWLTSTGVFRCLEEKRRSNEWDWVRTGGKSGWGRSASSGKTHVEGECVRDLLVLYDVL